MPRVSTARSRIIDITEPEIDEEFYAPVSRLSLDLARAAADLSDEEAKFLVTEYYKTQNDRKRSHNQQRALDKSGKPSQMISWLGSQNMVLEGQVKRALDKYTLTHPVGEWMRSLYGIGPVIAAGILAHVDITRSPTAGHIWAFAGLAGDGQKEWKKGTRRPFNAELKTICYHAGESFQKFSKRDECYYGKMYRKRKAYEIERNLAGGNAEAARLSLARSRDPNTENHKWNTRGMLSPAHLDARSRRWTVKYFLGDVHMIMYWNKYRRPSPKPFALARQDHVHLHLPPNHEMFPGLIEALRELGPVA